MTISIILLIIFNFIILVAIIAVMKMLVWTKNPERKSSYINDQIYVGNLSYRLNETDLQGYFSRFGTIQTIKIICNFKTGQSKGYAFVTYQSAKQAVKALAAHGEEFGGRSLVVRIAKPKQEQPAY